MSLHIYYFYMLPKCILNTKMSNIRKLSAIRQLSLNCNAPTPEQRRKTLKKQFSEDIPDYQDKWTDSGVGIKISLNTKISADRPPPIRIAWEENSPELKTEEAVIIKKCKEVRRGSTGKLSRQSSVEKDSILHSKQEMAERFRQTTKEKEQEKPNLKIFLAHNSREQSDDFYNNQLNRATSHYLEKTYERPKLIQPLMTNHVSNSKNLFQLRKNVRTKINLTEIAYSPTRSSDIKSPIGRSDSIVVVPIVEKVETLSKQQNVERPHSSISLKAKEDIKPIDSVIIRPVTAASKREKFQKRTNSAFNATIKESSHPRPTLIRSSSAPIKAERGKPKFVTTKRKIKTIKRVHLKTQSIDDELEDIISNKENPKTQKELNRVTAVNGTEVITMVSLVSPAGSDAEEEIVQENKEKTKCKNTSPSNNKSSSTSDEKEPRHLSLRKTVKSVSFQQSSIHAIRSFSASFPARRGSMATAIMLGHDMKTTAHGMKVQEKRSTRPMNSNISDDDERVPKRRLLRSNTEEQKYFSNEQLEKQGKSGFTNDEEKLSSDVNFSVDIKTKTVSEVTASDNIEINNQDEKNTEKGIDEEEDTKEEIKYQSPKEKQCWEMYCKMTEKGIKVTFDTILRGMLTPTEYRLTRKNSVISVEPPTDDTC